MTVRPIVTYPDPRLRMMAAPVTVFDAALATLAVDMLDTLRSVRGIGITAPHIGVLQRVVVLELTPGMAKTYINPVIAWASNSRIRHSEGSISMPGIHEGVERAAALRLTYQDLDGALRTEEAEGFAAVCHQHEIDQLDGLFWLQRLSRLKRERLVKRFDKGR